MVYVPEPGMRPQQATQDPQICTQGELQPPFLCKASQSPSPPSHRPHPLSLQTPKALQPLAAAPRCNSKAAAAATVLPGDGYGQPDEEQRPTDSSEEPQNLWESAALISTPLRSWGQPH